MDQEKMDTRLDEAVLRSQGGPPSEQRDVVDELRASKNIDEILAGASSRATVSSALGSPTEEMQKTMGAMSPRQLREMSE
jgi:hypothetical protein